MLKTLTVSKYIIKTLEIIGCKKTLCDREVIKHFERVFHLFDINGTGLVSKSEIAYNLLQIKDIVSDKLDLTLIENFEAFQVDQREVDVKYFKELI